MINISVKSNCISLGHYGDVHRVKILFNKKDSALIQFSDSLQAQTGMYFVNLVSIELPFLNIGITLVMLTWTKFETSVINLIRIGHNALRIAQYYRLFNERHAITCKHSGT